MFYIQTTCAENSSMQAIDPELFPWCSYVTEVFQSFALIERPVYFLKGKDEAVHPAFL
jgi:hypothetical protein